MDEQIQLLQQENMIRLAKQQDEIVTMLQTLTDVVETLERRLTEVETTVLHTIQAN
jgi:hypothetical protein